MQIVTVTLNPTIDKSSSVAHIKPDSKLRCAPPKYEPGGGGINVSRAIKKLGGDSLAVYLGGGASGEMLDGLMAKEGVKEHRIVTQNPTRENFVVVEESSSNQFRFGMPGAEVYQNEIDEVMNMIQNLDSSTEYLVGSGSLPPGVPVDIYGQMARICKNKGIRFIVDTSGDALNAALDEGVFLFKPNLGELSKLLGKEGITFEEQEDIVKQVISTGKSELVAVSMGPRGAMLASNHVIEYAVPPTTKKRSTVGAGDSMVAGMVLSLSQNHDLEDVIRMGVSAGTAATMNEGTELCRKEDVERIFNELKFKAKKY